MPPKSRRSSPVHRSGTHPSYTLLPCEHWTPSCAPHSVRVKRNGYTHVYCSRQCFAQHQFDHLAWYMSMAAPIVEEVTPMDETAALVDVVS